MMDGLGAGVLSNIGLHRVLCRHDSPPGHFQRQGRLHMEGREAQRDSIASLAGHEGEPCVRSRRVYGPVKVGPVCPRGAAAHRLRPHRRRNPRPSWQLEGSHEDERPSDLISEPSASALVAKTLRYKMGVADRNEIVYKIKDEFSTNYTVERTEVETTELPLSMQSAILTGLSRSPWEVEKEVLVQCPTSSCTWPPFRTLGVCQRCNNVTASLTRIGNFSDALVSISDAVVGRSGLIINNGSESPPSTAYSLPNGHFIANVNGCPLYSGYDGNSLCTKEVQEKTNAVYSEEKYLITSFGTSNPNKTNTMTDINTNLVHERHLPRYRSGQRIHLSVAGRASTGDRLLENITDATDAVRTPDSWHRGPEDSSLGPEYIPPPDEVNSLEFNPRYSAAGYSGLVLQAQDNETYTVSAHSVMSINAYLQRLFLANYTDANGPQAISDFGSEAVDELKNFGKLANLASGVVGINGASYFNSLGTKLPLKASPPALNNIWTWNMTNITSDFYTLSTSMTNEMRRNDRAYTTSLGQDGTMTQTGEVQRWTVVYEIQWPWIALHALTLLLGILFLCITLWSSEHEPLWKSSTLATIRRGYELGGALEGVDTVLEMERKAREAYVKVPPSGDGGESAACIRKVQADAAGVERVSGSFEGREREAAAR
ncbi:hypothetical protein V502_05804 [Pseudogymnoascus sp. VKM F-4520 (FW-2644)]|nr:hypothetical protein V502_05804 [Pseudogymnoascus sp. VKM F-4520 (FW-2644)]